MYRVEYLFFTSFGAVYVHVEYLYRFNKSSVESHTFGSDSYVYPKKKKKKEKKRNIYYPPRNFDKWY